jgi:hypothetical protein
MTSLVYLVILHIYIHHSVEIEDNMQQHNDNGGYSLFNSYNMKFLDGVALLFYLCFYITTFSFLFVKGEGMLQHSVGTELCLYDDNYNNPTNYTSDSSFFRKDLQANPDCGYQSCEGQYSLNKPIYVSIITHGSWSRVYWQAE